MNAEFEAPFELREWQSEALQKWVQSEFRGCVAVATGGGKTFFALTCFTYLNQIQKQSRILVVVPTTALLDQWFEAFVTDLSVPEHQVKILTTKDLKPDAYVNLVVINTARGFSSVDYQFDDLLFVVDECHRAAGDENSKALEIKTPYRLGLSATPYREYDDFFDSRIVPQLGGVLYEYSLEQAIDDGVLAKIRLRNLRVPMTTSEIEKFDALSKKAGRAFAMGNVEQASIYLQQRSRVSNSAKYRIPTVIALLDSMKGKRVIVFFEAIEDLRRVETALRDRGHHVTSYHSKLSDHLRRSNLRLFRRGVFQILLTCRALDEGFNVPEAEVAVIAAGTASKRQRVQRIGRVLRALPGKTDGEVITIYATDQEEERLLNEVELLHLENRTTWSKVKT